MPRTSAQIVRISMASSDVVLILFPVEWSYQSNTIWAWSVRFPYFPPMPLVLMWMAICTGVTPNLSWNLFPKFLQFFHGRILFFDHDHALTERCSALARILRPVFSFDERDIWERRSPSEGTALHHSLRGERSERI